MGYFDNAEVGEKVFGLVQGNLTIVDVVPKDKRIEGFAAITCENKEGKQFHYTINGLPGWALGYCNCQTLYYPKDLDMTELDTTATCRVLSEKKIRKLLAKDELQIRCPSGVWMNTDVVPEGLIERALKKDNYHLFREIE